MGYGSKVPSLETEIVVQDDWIVWTDWPSHWKVTYDFKAGEFSVESPHAVRVKAPDDAKGCCIIFSKEGFDPKKFYRIVINWETITPGFDQYGVRRMMSGWVYLQYTARKKTYAKGEYPWINVSTTALKWPEGTFSKWIGGFDVEPATLKLLINLPRGYEGILTVDLEEGTPPA